MTKQGRLSDVPVVKKAGEDVKGGIMGGGLGKVAWVAGEELQSDYASVHEVIKSMCVRRPNPLPEPRKPQALTLSFHPRA